MSDTPGKTGLDYIRECTGNIELPREEFIGPDGLWHSTDEPFQFEPAKLGSTWHHFYFNKGDYAGSLNRSEPTTRYIIQVMKQYTFKNGVVKRITAPPNIINPWLVPELYRHKFHSNGNIVSDIAEATDPKMIHHRFDGYGNHASSTYAGQKMHIDSSLVLQKRAERKVEWDKAQQQQPTAAITAPVPSSSQPVNSQSQRGTPVLPFLYPYTIRPEHARPVMMMSRETQTMDIPSGLPVPMVAKYAPGPSTSQPVPSFDNTRDARAAVMSRALNPAVPQGSQPMINNRRHTLPGPSAIPAFDPRSYPHRHHPAGDTTGTQQDASDGNLHFYYNADGTFAGAACGGHSIPMSPTTAMQSRQQTLPPPLKIRQGYQPPMHTPPQYAQQPAYFPQQQAPQPYGYHPAAAYGFPQVPQPLMQIVQQPHHLVQGQNYQQMMRPAYRYDHQGRLVRTGASFDDALSDIVESDDNESRSSDGDFD